MHKITHQLSKDLHAKIEIDRVDFSLFNRMNLEGVCLQDRYNDTLLYAGFVQVRITDWFFFKDNISLKYIGLKNAIVKTQRTDSVWNYEFLMDYFSSSNKSSSESKSKLSLQQIRLENIQFIQRDGWNGKNLYVSLHNLAFEAEDANTKNNQYYIRSIHIDRPTYFEQSYQGLKPNSNVVIKKDSNAVKQPFEWNPNNLQLFIDHISITDGVLGMQKLPTKAIVPGSFSDVNIVFEKINGSLSKVQWLKDTITTHIDLSTQEQSGLQVKTLQANCTIHPRAIIFDQLILRTNNSQIKNYFAMRYYSINDLSQFEKKVQLEANLTSSILSSNDLSLFAPKLKNWNMKFLLTGHVKGTLDNMVGTNMNIHTDNSSSSFSGNITLTNLSDVKHLYIHANQIHLRTKYSDIVKIAPALKRLPTVNLIALSNIKYTGNFSGFLNNFSSLGLLETNIGNVQTDVNIQIQKNDLTAYIGKLKFKGFQLGTFLHNSELGIIEGAIELEGKGTNRQASTNLIMQLRRLDYKGYSYSNVVANGKLNHNNYTGVVKVNDPNLKFNLDVIINTHKDSSQFSIIGEVQQLQAKALGITKNDVHVDGLFDFNFKGKNIDAFTGYVKMFNTNVFHEGVRLNLDSIVLKTEARDAALKILSLQSNEINASIIGEYKIIELGDEFKRLAHQYLPAYIEAPTHSVQKQNFSYSIQMGSIDGYLSLFNPDLKGFSDAKLSGTLQSSNNKITINGNIPSFSYKNFSANNFYIKGDGTNEKLDLTVQTDNIVIDDSLYFPYTTLNLSTRQNVSELKLSTSANRSLSAANVEATINTYEDGIGVYFKPSSFVLNDKIWEIKKAGEIVYRNKTLSANNVTFSTGEQQLIVQTQPSETGNHNDLYIDLRNIVIADFLPLALKKPSMEGLMNGKIVVSDPFGDMYAYTDTALHIEQFQLDTNMMGALQVKANYRANDGKLVYEVISPNVNYDFIANGVINLKDSSGVFLYNNLVMNGMELGIFKPYLSSVFSTIDGKAYGQLQTSITHKKFILEGIAYLQQTHVTSAYTNVTYTIDTAKLICKDGSIRFEEFNLKDRFNNIGKAKGVLSFANGFNNINYDISIDANRLELMNTTSISQQPFYGEAVGIVHFSIKGPQADMKMLINAEPTDSSAIFIRNSNSRQSAEADFIVWKQYGTELQTDKKANNNNLTIDLDIKVNNLTKINMILDEVAGDVISATGSGNLCIHTGTVDPLTMRGRYNIEKGAYKFNFQSLVTKPFILEEGAGNFIEWNGDPLDARINIEAKYITKEVRFSDLTSGLSKNSVGNFSDIVQTYRGNVYVIAKLTGKLSQPIIDFKLLFPAESPINNDITAASFLKRIESDKNELLKQITYLIVLNSFAPYGENRVNTSGNSLIGNTLSSVFASKLNNIVANTLSKIMGKNLSIDFNASFYSSADLLSGNSSILNSFERSQVNLKIGTGLFNNKVIITFGSDFDFKFANNSAVNSSIAGGFQYLPNVKVEFILSKDRRLKAIVFYNNLPDPTTPSGQRNRSGASLSYQRDFNRLLGKKPEVVKDSMNIQADH